MTASVQPGFSAATLVPDTQPSPWWEPTRLARYVLLGFIAFMFSGGFYFAAPISVLRLAIYGLGFLSFVVYLVLDLKGLERIASVLPYLGWVVFFFAWGAFVSPLPYLVMDEIQTLIIRNIIFLSVIALAVSNRSDLTVVANLFQIAAIVNASISIWSMFDSGAPSIIQGWYDNVGGGMRYMETRPAALWLDPNTASFCWLFTFLLARWAQQPLAWIGAVSAVIGIYFTSSRSGVFLLLLSFLLLMAFWTKDMRFNLLKTSMWNIVLALLLAIFLTLDASDVDLPAIELPNLDGFQRVISSVEEGGESASGEGSRSYLFNTYLTFALRGPWYGYGAFVFHGSDGEAGYPLQYTPGHQGSHNVHLTVYGEAGPFGMLTYVVMLLAGIGMALSPKLDLQDRFVLGLLWLSYLVIGTVRHTVFSGLDSMIYAGFLFHIPYILRRAADAAPARPPDAPTGVPHTLPEREGTAL